MPVSLPSFRQLMITLLLILLSHWRKKMNLNFKTSFLVFASQGRHEHTLNERCSAVMGPREIACYTVGTGGSSLPWVWRSPHRFSSCLLGSNTCGVAKALTWPWKPLVTWHPSLHFFNCPSLPFMTPHIHLPSQTALVNLLVNSIFNINKINIGLNLSLHAG